MTNMQKRNLEVGRFFTALYLDIADCSVVSLFVFCNLKCFFLSFTGISSPTHICNDLQFSHKHSVQVNVYVFISSAGSYVI